jgi:hypothetical protein
MNNPQSPPLFYCGSRVARRGGVHSLQPTRHIAGYTFAALRCMVPATALNVSPSPRFEVSHAG